MSQVKKTLNKSERLELVWKVCSKVLGPVAKEVALRINAYTDAIYDSHYAKDEKKILRAVGAERAKEIIGVTSRIGLQHGCGFDYYSVELCDAPRKHHPTKLIVVEGSSSWRANNELSKQRLRLYGRSDEKVHGFNGDAGLEQHHTELTAWLRETFKRAEKLVRDTEAVILHTPRTDRLLELVPECKEFLPNEPAKSTALVPQESIEELRAAIKDGMAPVTDQDMKPKRGRRSRS